MAEAGGPVAAGKLADAEAPGGKRIAGRSEGEGRRGVGGAATVRGGPRDSAREDPGVGAAGDVEGDKRPEGDGV